MQAREPRPLVTSADPRVDAAPLSVVPPAGPVRLQHVDLYRLESHEVDDLLLEDLMDGAVMAVEWPDRWTRSPADAVRVEIVPIGDNERRLTIAHEK